MKTSLRVFLSFWLFFGTAWAHEGHDRAAAPKAAKAELGASAAIAADGRWWVVSKESIAKDVAYVVVRASADEGKSWTAPVRVHAVAEAVAADGDARPKIVLGPGGEIYVSWTKPLAKPYTGDVRFSRSLDGGKSFSPPQTVNTDRRVITHRFDSLAVDGAGRVYIAWIDKRRLEDAKQAKQAYRGAAVYVAVSDDQGATFAREAKVADHSCECCRIALVADGQAGVLAFWRHVFEPNLRDHALAKIDAQAKTQFVRRATFDDWTLDACPHQGPALALDGEGVPHAVWFTEGRRTGVQYGRLRDGGVEGQRTVGSDTAAYADIAANGTRLLLVWKDFDGKATRLWAMRSDDGGASWREQQLTKTVDASDQPRALQNGGKFYVFWNTRADPFKVFALP